MANSGCSLSLTETNYPSNTLSTFVSAHYICSVKCAPLLREVGFADAGSQAFCLRAASLRIYTPCLFLRRTQIIFFWSTHRKSLVADIWKWGHRDCYLQIWEHTTLSGSSMLPACLWRKVQDKQKPPSRTSSHIK